VAGADGRIFIEEQSVDGALEYGVLDTGIAQYRIDFFQYMLLGGVKGLGGQPTLTKLGPRRLHVPQRPQAVIDDERYEVRPCRLLPGHEIVPGYLRESRKQCRTVIIEPCHVVILADS
jgi:hypothetical protein